MTRKDFIFRFLMVLAVVLTMTILPFAMSVNNFDSSSSTSEQTVKKENKKKKKEKGRKTPLVKKNPKKSESYAEYKKRIEEERRIRLKRLRERQKSIQSKPRYYPGGKKPNYRRVIVPPPGASRIFAKPTGKKIAPGRLPLVEGQKGAKGKTSSIARKANITPKGISLKYDDADLYDFIDVVSNVLGINYIIDPAVSGRVTINMNKPVPKEALFSIFVDILRINGATIVKSGNIYHIVPISEGNKYPLEVKKITPESEMIGNELTTYVVPIQYVPSSDLAKLLGEFITDKAKIIDYPSYNILVITDFKDNLKKLMGIIKMLDSGFFDINKIELINIKFNKAEDVAKDLEAVFNAGANNGGVKFIPVPRMNSILVVCHSPKSLEEVYKWIKKLDVPSTHGVETFVYKVENTTASNIADILAQLFSDMGAQTSTVGAQSKPISTGAGGTSRQGFTGGGQLIRPELRGTTRGGVSPIQGLSGSVKIITDDLNNNLIIQGTQADYEFLLKTIKKLDVLPRQVLIEAKIIRVDLSGQLKFGVGAWLQARSDKFPATTADIHYGEGGSTPPGINVNTVTVFGIGNSKEVNMVLNALETQSKVEVLESPTILVLDGNEANINVGKSIPIATSTFSNPYLAGQTTQEGGTYNVTNTQIQYRQTGVNLSVAPRISASGIVTLEIAEEVSSPGNKDEGLAGSPPINQSLVQTTMIVKDGNSIVIAGIMSESNENSRSAVPLLGRIPILGWLFSSTSKTKTKSELLAILTPHVIRTTDEAKKTSDRVIKGLKNINKFIEKKKKSHDFGILKSYDENKIPDKGINKK